MTLGRYSLGVGDRFAHEAEAQLRAFTLAAQRGRATSRRSGTSPTASTRSSASEPASVRAAADAAVRALDWQAPVLRRCRPRHPRDGRALHRRHATSSRSTWRTRSAGRPAADRRGVRRSPRRPHRAARHSRASPSRWRSRATRPSASAAQVPARRRRGRRASTATSRRARATRPVRHRGLDGRDRHAADARRAAAHPGRDRRRGHPRRRPSRRKFSGRFNKGVDYVGDVAQFEREFADDVAVIAYAVKAFGLPRDLKLSVHSGSDKFSIYRAIRRALRPFDAGVHLKTAGTTWLEELIGLAEAGGDGPGDRQGRLPRRLRAPRRALRARTPRVIDIDPAPAAAAGRVSRLVGRAGGGGAAARPVEPGLQRQLPSAPARGLQGRRRQWRTFLSPARVVSRADRAQRDREPLRAAPGAPVPVTLRAWRSPDRRTAELPPARPLVRPPALRSSPVAAAQSNCQGRCGVLGQSRHGTRL